jgi:hypothetical protein
MSTQTVYVVVRAADADYDVITDEEVLSAHATLEGAKASLPYEWEEHEGVWFVSEGKRGQPKHHYVAELPLFP